MLVIKKIGVLRSRESLEAGSSVISALRSKYKVKDIFIDEHGKWYFDGLVSSPQIIFNNVDLLLNCLSGSESIDNSVHQTFDIFGVPYTGSGSLAIALGVDKVLAKEFLEDAGIKMPKSIVLEGSDDPSELAGKVFRMFSPPWRVRPVKKNRSIKTAIANGFHNLIGAIGSLFYRDHKVLVEEHLSGRRISVGVIESFRGQRHYPFSLVEFVEYGGERREIYPRDVSSDIKKEIERLSIEAHKALNCRHYSVSDFILVRGKINFLGVDPLPSLSSQSFLSKSADNIGLSHPNLLDHLIILAINR